MSSNVKLAVDAGNNAITCSLASLANGSARQSTVVDNSVNLYLDALFFLKVRSGASGTVLTGAVNIYAYGTVDGGTTYTENAGGPDAGITLAVPTNARFVGAVNVVAITTTYYGGPFSIGQAFGGILPVKWGVIIENKSGGALDSTEGNHAKLWQAVYATVG